MKKYFEIIAVVVLLVFNACDSGSDSIEDVPAIETDYDVMIDVNETKGTVSPLLMGFNTIYCFEADAMWQNGNGQIPALMKKMNAGILRYPGGAVVNRYHWNNLNGEGWMDNWDPNYDSANDQPESEFMDVDEYMANVNAIGAEPMVGVNMGSGLKYNRVQDGIDEAVALVQYCLDNGYDVKYWYLDNEAYHDGANYTMTATEYAEQINLYAPAMRALNPDIEFIVNWTRNITSGTSSMQTLIEQAGANIDIMEVHWYWQYGQSTFDLWLNSFPMGTKNQWYNGFDYVREIMAFKPLVNSLGHGHIKLASNEWNLGPSPSEAETPSKFESALMISEQFSQFIDGGLFMASFWGVQWPHSTGAAVNRYLVDPTNNYSPNPLVSVFEMFGDAMGGMQVKCSSLKTGVYDIAVLNEETNELYIYLLNKTQDSALLSAGVELKGVNVSEVIASSFVRDEANGDAAKISDVQVLVENGNRLVLELPKNSLTKVVVNP